MTSLLRSLFGCRHHKLSRAFAHASGGHYVVCLTCGKEFAYCWDQMKVGAAIEPPRPRRFNDGLETKI